MEMGYISQTGYIIWFIVTAVWVVALLAFGVAKAAGMFGSDAKLNKQVRQDEAVRLRKQVQQRTAARRVRHPGWPRMSH